LHNKGETAEEIALFVQHLIDRAMDPLVEADKLPGPIVDVCGTGGDGLNIFNVSTTIMFILAAGGAVVVKHGNRGVTSLSGSADVLEALGVRVDLRPEQLRECVQSTGLGFIFARQYHPAYRALAEMRTRLITENQRTIFNLLGPLLNPARPSRQLIGVYAPRLTTMFAEVLHRLGRDRAWIVHGLTQDGAGMDDISTSGATTLAELQDNKVVTGVIDARWLGIPEATVAELTGGGVEDNAAILKGILSGEIKGAKRDLAVLNAAGAFIVAGLVGDISEGLALAREQIDNGRALAKLTALQEFSAKS
jgi:anthranilate phosphoribosyltransferase